MTTKRIANWSYYFQEEKGGESRMYTQKDIWRFLQGTVEKHCHGIACTKEDIIDHEAVLHIRDARLAFLIAL